MKTHDSTGWLLVAGLALLALGLLQERGVAGAPQDPPSGTVGYPLGFEPQPSGQPAFATADSNDRMIAVTGLDVTGSSILYLIDTRERQLSVYQATGGTDSMMNVKWVGARNIDLDLRVDGFNDQSQYSYKELAAQLGETPEDDGAAALSVPSDG